MGGKSPESRRFVASLAILLALIGGAASAQTIMDGDTIKLNGTIYRLWGIDAPETKQFCDGAPMGGAAAEALANLMRGKTVTCEERTKDRYGRTVALCRADGVDLGAAMVESGWAFAFVRYSRDYVALEERARAENIGLHPFHCELPWEWRARLRGGQRTFLLSNSQADAG
jgi:endonuclease YncB( thermonuclease family)